ncbi:hypothetical protein BH695_4605 [Microcystis aeruginosa PCC 7806SL]|uniref:Uncharacterized protein n=1 Tax=Microcystis aeruginosa PCC 7806SL TaxID=1903187 RepID=A0AB33BVS3_MICA7|nr:hypothetical protein BH695_4605 [Microcystis aeruginosa PCC 7806SL]
MKWGRWGSGEAVSSHPITPKPYHPKTLSPQNPITRTMFTDRPET